MSCLILPPNDRIEVGTDEIGKGSLIHNVVAGAVIMPPEYDEDDRLIYQIKDSKKCSKKQLLILNDYIKDTALAWGIGKASAREIDELNIDRATMLAMHRALDQVYKQIPFDFIIVDGDHFKPYFSLCQTVDDITEYVPHACIVGGDNTHVGIASASIIAKVDRDHEIVRLYESDPKFTPYGWNTNRGYGSSAHIKAIQTFGATEHHRMTFLKRILY
jgi:ribonuclease HII